MKRVIFITGYPPASLCILKDWGNKQLSAKRCLLLKTEVQSSQVKDRQVWWTLGNPRAPARHKRLPVMSTCLYKHACTPSHKSTHTSANMHIHTINTCKQEIEHTRADLNLEVAALLHLLLLDINLNLGLFCTFQFKVNPISQSDITSSRFYPFCHSHFLIRVFRNMNLHLFFDFFQATYTILSPLLTICSFFF